MGLQKKRTARYLKVRVRVERREDKTFTDVRSQEGQPVMYAQGAKNGERRTQGRCDHRTWKVEHNGQTKVPVEVKLEQVLVECVVWTRHTTKLPKTDMWHETDTTSARPPFLLYIRTPLNKNLCTLYLLSIHYYIIPSVPDSLLRPSWRVGGVTRAMRWRRTGDIRKRK